MPGHGHQPLVLRSLLSASFVGMVSIRRPLHRRRLHHVSLVMQAPGLFPVMLHVLTVMLERGLR